MEFEYMVHIAFVYFLGLLYYTRAARVGRYFYIIHFPHARIYTSLLHARRNRLYFHDSDEDV